MGRLVAGAFGVMRHRNFRYYWFGFLVSNAGGWIQAVAQAWLVLELTNSPGWVGLVGFVRAFPLLTLSLIGGTVADRFPKRRILYITQTVQMSTALLLGALTYTGVVAVWHVILLSAITASAHAFDNPTRHSLLPRLVPKADLHQAISINAIAFNGAALFGPSLTGILVPLFGLAGSFFINAGTFLAVFIALFAMDFPAHEPPQRKQSLVADLREGVRFMWQDPVIMGLIAMAAFSSLVARPYVQFLPVFARNVLHGPIGLAGLLQSATALGTILFMLTVVSLGQITWKGRLLMGSGIGLGLSLIAFAWAGSIPLSLALLVLVGGFNMTWMTSIQTLLQENLPDAMRGRVMSAFTITALAMMPMGQGPMGLNMELLGPQWAVTIGGVLSTLFLCYVAFVRVKAIPRLP